jgi:hypothetical protein
MTTIYNEKKSYSLESKSDCKALIEACKNNETLTKSVKNFEPSGSWCIPDGKGDYLKDEKGMYLSESLTEQGLKNYLDVLTQINSSQAEEKNFTVLEILDFKKDGELWEPCTCGAEPVYMPLHLCAACWPKNSA